VNTLFGLAELEPGRLRVACIGIFDGLHRGHRRVLRRLVAEARRRGALATAVTFAPHPEAILRGAPPPRLSDPEQLVEEMERLDVDELVVQPFDQAFSRLEPEAFLRLLGAGAGLRAFVMTPSTTFGHERRGDRTAVATIGKRLRFGLVLVEPLSSGGRPVSSSRIRRSIGAGRLAEARRLLGHSPSVTGRVVLGAGRGRDLGFPTANLAFDVPVALPPDGIYAVRVAWRPDPMARGGGADAAGRGGRGVDRRGGVVGEAVGAKRPSASVAEPAMSPSGGRSEWRTGFGVASLGVRPTFGAGDRVLEVHVFDVDEPLYGATMRVEFVRRQRGERRFSGPDALVAQMRRDAARARGILGI
jgi:riboflavin kinase/FMN adenylyltransferase